MQGNDFNDHIKKVQVCESCGRNNETENPGQSGYCRVN